jgi:hypothetical protein
MSNVGKLKQYLKKSLLAIEQLPDDMDICEVVIEDDFDIVTREYQALTISTYFERRDAIKSGVLDNLNWEERIAFMDGINLKVDSVKKYKPISLLKLLQNIDFKG